MSECPATSRSLAALEVPSPRVGLLPPIVYLGGDHLAYRQRGRGPGGRGVQDVDDPSGAPDEEVIDQRAVGPDGLGPDPGRAGEEIVEGQVRQVADHFGE